MISGLSYLLYYGFLLDLLGVICFYQLSPMLTGIWEFLREITVLLFLVLAAWLWGFPGGHPGGEQSPGEIGENRESRWEQHHLCEDLF